VAPRPFRIEAVELRRVAMPLVSPFRTSFGTEAVRDVMLVRVLTGAAEGWGECVARSEPLYSPEFVDAAVLAARDHLVPRVWPAERPEDVPALLRPVKGQPMAKGAVELGVLDAWLRTSGVSLAAYLGGTRDRVDVGVSVGIAPSIDALMAEVSGFVDDGYRRVKLKIEPGWDVEPVAAVRAKFPGLQLQVDANGAYTLGDTDVFAALDGFGLLLIEQPLPEDDLSGHATLARRLATPICLDESITSAARAAEAIDRGACAIVNIKAGRVGGYLEAKAVHDACVDRRVPVWCGGMLETGLGRAANLALASLPGFTYPADLSASERYFTTDLTHPFVLERGQLAVPAGPGIGIAPLAAALQEFTTWVTTLRP
jgi:O-succinylbenzoate synthase